MKILSIYSGLHDSAVALFDEYQVLAAISKERITRKKGDQGLSIELIDEVLDIAGINKDQIDVLVLSRDHIPLAYINLPWHKELEYRISKKGDPKKLVNLLHYVKRHSKRDIWAVFSRDAFLKDYGFPPELKIVFSNHHFSHSLPALFYSGLKDNVLIYTADGGGDGVYYSAHHYKAGKLDTIFGGEDESFKKGSINSLGKVYSWATKILGYRPLRHEGKVTGLASHGSPIFYDEMSRHFKVLDNGVIATDFTNNKQMESLLCTLSEGKRPEDIAASVQKLLEETILCSCKAVVSQHQAKNLVLSGGVFANVSLNRRLCEELEIEKIFVYPAMGDDGLSVGGALQYLLSRDGLEEFMENAVLLDRVYYGRDYTNAIDGTMKSSSQVQQLNGSSVSLAAKLMSEGQIGAIYTGRMEFGPRALGARSIIASPEKESINGSLNERLERTEFMPFAPYVMEEDARDVFHVTDANELACQFMTITCLVKDKWRDKIPAVVHVDGTARPQIIKRELNPLYYDILKEFKAVTGLPVLVNTSFNAHEEPIINTPNECLKALLDKRVDFIVTQESVYKLRSS